MITPPTADVLRETLRRESRSLLQYVDESFPWASPEEREVLAQLRKLIAEERQVLASLGQYLVRQRITPPHLGPYPMEFTTINYVSLDHLLPMLVSNQQQAIAALERDLASLAEPEARAQVERILAMKQRHLETLEGMAAAHSDQAAAPPATAATVK